MFHPTRDLVFVKDTVSGFIDIFNSKELIGEEVNIATQTEISIEKLVQLIFKLTGIEASIVTASERLRPLNSEVFRLFGSNLKISEKCNWSPKYSLEQGLKETIEWFSNSENLLKYKANIYNI